MATRNSTGPTRPNSSTTPAADKNDAIAFRDDRAMIALHAVNKLSFLLDSLMPMAIQLDREEQQTAGEQNRSSPSSFVGASSRTRLARCSATNSRRPKEAQRIIEYGSELECYDLAEAEA